MEDSFFLLLIRNNYHEDHCNFSATGKEEEAYRWGPAVVVGEECKQTIRTQGKLRRLTEVRFWSVVLSSFLSFSSNEFILYLILFCFQTYVIRSRADAASIATGKGDVSTSLIIHPPWFKLVISRCKHTLSHCHLNMLHLLRQN
jgi:hypothetical protein